jgi:hypothetical protein
VLDLHNVHSRAQQKCPLLSASLGWTMAILCCTFCKIPLGLAGRVQRDSDKDRIYSSSCQWSVECINTNRVLSFSLLQTKNKPQGKGAIFSVAGVNFTRYQGMSTHWWAWHAECLGGRSPQSSRRSVWDFKVASYRLSPRGGTTSRLSMRGWVAACSRHVRAKMVFAR